MEYADSYILDHYQPELATRWLFDSIRILRFAAASDDENHQESRMHILSLVSKNSKPENIRNSRRSLAHPRCGGV